MSIKYMRKGCWLDLESNVEHLRRLSRTSSMEKLFHVIEVVFRHELKLMINESLTEEGIRKSRGTREGKIEKIDKE